MLHVTSSKIVNRRGVRAPIGHPKCLINFVSTGSMLRSDSQPRSRHDQVETFGHSVWCRVPLFAVHFRFVSFALSAEFTAVVPACSSKIALDIQGGKCNRVNAPSL